MDLRILVGLIVALIAAAVVLSVMLSSASKENASLKTALAAQGAVLAETRAELALRDAVIKKRDAEIAEAERKAEQQGRAYAKLKREKKDVRDWADSPVPADVRGLLEAAGADRAAGPTCGADGRGGNP